MFYPKIKTLYNRDEKFKVKPSSQFYTEPVFGNVQRWLLTEKVDGTNMSVLVQRDRLDSRITEATVRGRTANAQLEMFTGAIKSIRLGPETLQYFNEYDCLHNDMRNLLDEHELDSIEFFGEAFGPGIQSGGWYADAQRFLVYDVRVNGSTWLNWSSVQQAVRACELNTVPVVQSSATIPFARHLVRQGFKSSLTADERPCEGVVARPATGELYDNRGQRVCWKLKFKDF